MKKMSNKTRNTIRVIGIIGAIIGIILIVSGFTNLSFAASALGMVLLFISTIFLNFGFMGKTHQIAVSETIETNTEATNYMLDKTKGNLKEIIGSVNNNDTPKRICKHCGAINDITNNYCFDCGKKIKE
ncbi:zinc ribbon domain-containing protein [Haploplasma modicum]|uniref:zinc ribbon domain-containing protein n=1 Tax=Haploplasma modicum TaxID=2150 RepID=UPI00214B298C|nr:zinc ribbon domain-containing protein [Haploplasma modicum]MCR1809466.1 hypothetical protein [Haploplasma modicum]